MNCGSLSVIPHNMAAVAASMEFLSPSAPNGAFRGKKPMQENIAYMEGGGCKRFLCTIIGLLVRSPMVSLN